MPTTAARSVAAGSSRNDRSRRSRPRGVRVPDGDVSAHAERVLSATRVERSALALEFDESGAAAASVHVGGRSFFPRLLADIDRARSSVHIIQFGFRPGTIGDQFAAALEAKASAGVPVRLIVDRNGTDPEGGSQALYARLVGAGVQVCTSRGTQIRAPFGPLGADSRPQRWNVGALGHVDHRKMLVIDGRVGWVGGAGIEDHFDDGRFHDLFVRFEGPVVSQLQLVFLTSLRWLGGTAPAREIDALFPAHDVDGELAPAVVLHNAPGRFRPITDAIASCLDSAVTSLEVINPYVTDRGMIRRMIRAAERGVRVRLFVPGRANNWACGAAERHHHRRLLAAGVDIFEHPQMLHAKAFVRDGEEVIAGTCNLEAWSLKRFFEIDVRVESRDLARQFEERFVAPAVEVSSPGGVPSGFAERAKSAAFAALSPLL
jgi:cardiolipin synthase A/B